MIPYLFAWFLLFLAAFQLKGKGLEWIAIGVLFFISFFRGETIGDDTINYMTYDIRMAPTGIKQFEYLFHFVHSLIPVLGRYTVIEFFTITTFVFIILSCKRYGVRPVMAFFFFVIFKYFNISLNVSRQFAAASVLLYAYSFLDEKGKKKLWFFLLILLAGGIHAPAYFFSLAFLLGLIPNKTNLSNGKQLIILILLYLLLDVYLAPLFSNWAQSFDMVGLESYSNYFEQAENLEKGSFNGMVLRYGTIGLNIFIYYKLLCLKSKIKHPIVLPLFAIAILVSAFLTQFYGNLGRLQYYLTMINIIAYSYYFTYTQTNRKTIVLLAIFVFWGSNYIWDLQQGSFWTVPYSTRF